MTKKQKEIADYCKKYKDATNEEKRIIYNDAFNMIPPCEAKECEAYIKIIEENLNYSG